MFDPQHEARGHLISMAVGSLFDSCPFLSYRPVFVSEVILFHRCIQTNWLAIVANRPDRCHSFPTISPSGAAADVP